LKSNFSPYKLLLFFTLAFYIDGFSQDVNVLYRDAQRLEESKKDVDALRKYLDVVKYQPNHVAALCKISELNCLVGSRQQEKSARLQYYRSARSYAEAALKVNPNYSEANFVMAMAMGRLALLVSGSEKIHAVTDIKKYAENAIRLDNSNFKAYHVLGKWHYEVSSLNSFERIAVKLFYGGLPASSFADAIRCYEKSRALNPEFALNYLEVAKAYRKIKQDKKAIEVLKKLQTIPVTTTDDPRIKTEGNKMLQELLD
jgi:tetratricopeptide (TPR) repeat protein